MLILVLVRLVVLRLVVLAQLLLLPPLLSAHLQCPDQQGPLPQKVLHHPHGLQHPLQGPVMVLELPQQQLLRLRLPRPWLCSWLVWQQLPLLFSSPQPLALRPGWPFQEAQSCHADGC